MSNRELIQLRTLLTVALHTLHLGVKEQKILKEARTIVADKDDTNRSTEMYQA